MSIIPNPNVILELNISPVAIKGDDGISAYEIALENGFVGTEQDWLDSFQDRANHIGTQPINTIQNLQDSLDSKINTTEIGISVQPYDPQTVTYTQSEKDKLGTIAEGAEVNVNADWSAVSGDAQILNKPVLSTVATTGAYSDLSGLPTLGTASATNITDYATSAQGAKADTALQPDSIVNFETTTQLNSRDTANRNRENHTGIQPISSIENLQTFLDSKQPTGDYATNTALTNGLATKQPTGDYATNTTLTNGLATKEPNVATGTTGQYWRGDKTFQTLDKVAVGLGSVDNVSDLNKPVSTATQTALDTKIDKPILNLSEINYWIDGNFGNDSFDGLTPQTAWASLSKITADLVQKDTTIKVYISQATYNKSTDYFVIETVNKDTLNANLELWFEPNTIMDGVGRTADTINAFELSGNIAWTCYIFGNNLTIRNFVSTNPSFSPNGVGNRGVQRVIVYDTFITNCADGFSAHANSYMEIHNSTAENCTKSPFLHVQSSTAIAFNCTFKGNSLQLTDSLTTTIKCYNCVFQSQSTPSLLGAGNGKFYRCTIGSETLRVQITSGFFYDCFVNAYVDGNAPVTLSRCFGKFSLRVRSSGTGVSVTNCVFTNPATGQPSVIFSNFNSGGSSPLIFNNNILIGSYTLMSVDATNAQYLVNANAQLFNNLLYPNLVYDSDLINADPSQLVIKNTLYQDPLIQGTLQGVNQEDYGFSINSPAKNAGVNNTHVGFFKSIKQILFDPR